MMEGFALVISTAQPLDELQRDLKFYEDTGKLKASKHFTDAFANANTAIQEAVREAKRSATNPSATNSSALDHNIRELFLGKHAGINTDSVDAINIHRV